MRLPRYHVPAVEVPMASSDEPGPSGTVPPDRLLSLWAKLPHDKATPPSYHPLLAHLIDVAQVAHAMWQEVLPPAARSRVTSALGLGEDEDIAGHWVAF